MKTITTGTLNDRVVQLDESLELPNNCRVSVSLEPIDPEPECAKAALVQFLKRADERAFNSGGVRFTRDEMHERG